MRTIFPINQLPKRPFLCAEIGGSWRSIFLERFPAAELCNSSPFWSFHTFQIPFLTEQSFSHRKLLSPPIHFYRGVELAFWTFGTAMLISLTTHVSMCSITLSKVETAFRMFDTDQDGFLSWEEFQQVRKK